jgi:hypothetical protein
MQLEVDVSGLSRELFQVCTNIVALPSWGFAHVAIKFAPKCVVSLGPWFAYLFLQFPCLWLGSEMGAAFTLRPL